VAQVGSGQPSMVWVWKISPKNVKFSIFFPSDKKNLFRLGQKVPGSMDGQPLIYCRSKVCSVQFRSGRVRSGTISTLKGGLAGIDQGETWPAGLRRGKLLGGWLGQVRLG